MSRRIEEFKHRTSIFEGAYRAWSHLGGCDATKLLSADASEVLFDPLANPHRNDYRLAEDIMEKQESDTCTENDVRCSTSGGSSSSSNVPRTSEIEYAYEPLPRQGLNHPFVLSILAPWLGPNASRKDIKKGLSTLRHWWQHRKSGENTTQMKQLGTEKMKKVVNGYTRHFFKVAFYMVIRDNQTPPRSLDLCHEQKKSKIKKGDQHKQFDDESSNEVSTISSRNSIDLGCCGLGRNRRDVLRKTNDDVDHQLHQGLRYGSPNKTPVVFVSANGDIQIALNIQGITCENCVNIIETGLTGAVGAPSSPIEGLLDAVANEELSVAILKISKASYAKRIVSEATELLGSLGYTCIAKEMDVVDSHGVQTDFASLTAAFDIVAATNTADLFDWSLKCSCTGNSGVHYDCERHSQMKINKRIFEAFDKQEQKLMSYVAGCGKKHGMPCTCPPGTCKCKSGTCCNPATTNSAFNQSGAAMAMNPMSNISVFHTDYAAANFSAPSTSRSESIICCSNPVSTSFVNPTKMSTNNINTATSRLYEDYGAKTTATIAAARLAAVRAGLLMVPPLQQQYHLSMTQIDEPIVRQQLEHEMC